MADGGAVIGGSANGRAFRLRRSCLAVPGSSPKMLAKAPTLPADQVFLDLEDSVSANAKEDARGHVIEALRAHDWGDKTVVVRVNDCTTRWTTRDILTVVGEAGDRLHCVMVPKVRDAGQVAFVDHLLAQLEMEHGWERGRIGLEIQLEDASGLVNAREILAASARIETLIFGPGDMAAALRMPSLTVGELRPDYPGDPWHWVHMQILVHARHAGVQAIDGPYARIADLDGFREVANRTRTLGYDGKWVLHPGQIAAANEIYAIPLLQYERAVDIADAMAIAARDERRGAVMFGSEMIDEATRKLTEVAIAQGRRAGLTVRPTPADVPPHARAAWRAANDPGPAAG